MAKPEKSSHEHDPIRQLFHLILAIGALAIGASLLGHSVKHLK